MFNELTSGLTTALRNIFAQKQLNESNIESALNEVKNALLSADVHFRVAKDLVERVRVSCIGQKVFQDVSPSQQVVKIVHDEIAATLGSAEVTLNPARPLSVILSGLQGSGKTTTAGKLATLLKKQGLRVMLVACDLQRPAAILQLQTLATQSGVSFFSLPGATSPIDVARAALQQPSVDVFIFDTAGRLQIDTALMTELAELQKVVQAPERFLVIDAALGQQSVAVAQQFHATLSLTGLILAKLDGDSRGGAALSIRSLTGVPIRYSGIGEKLSDLEIFYPQRMAGRILGMGDVVSLVEQAQANLSQSEAQKMAERALSDDFSLNDLLAQFSQMKKMGDLNKMVKLIPGMSNVQVGSEEQRKMSRNEAIILSMTPRERLNAQLITGSRLLRIAKGAGVPLKDVNALLKQYHQMRDVMRQMKGSKGREMMKRMQQMGIGK